MLLLVCLSVCLYRVISFFKCRDRETAGHFLAPNQRLGPKVPRGRSRGYLTTYVRKAKRQGPFRVRDNSSAWFCFLVEHLKRKESDRKILKVLVLELREERRIHTCRLHEIKGFLNASEDHLQKFANPKFFFFLFSPPPSINIWYTWFYYI